ncbi:MAG: hypothetical protein CL946_09715 [Ectothiorhodospiraceae bacterium]|nr:hypothetical protein [Ectothiorhodospiraceae bacterium]
MFAGIDKDIQKIFFSLSEQSLDTLFKRYGQLHGKSAENYARKTFPNWKSGKTNLSGQTAERLLNLIPPYLPQNVKYELITKLRNHYFQKKNSHVSTTNERWQADVFPVVEELIKVSSDFKLPESLVNRAAWLANGDVEAANKILASLELEEAKVRSNYLDIEFNRIQSLVDHMPHTQSIRHCIELPQGNIYVVIEQEKQTLMQSLFGGRKVTSGGKELVTREQMQSALTLQQSRGSLLNIALDDLTEQQKKQLTQSVLDARLGLDISQAEADQRFGNSTRDMGNTIKAVNSLEQSSKSDYEVKSTFKTASGTTDIHVKKNNNTVIIIVAIVIGVVVLAMMK